MTESLSKYERNLSATIHASTFSRFFIPFGNFILPLVLWMGNRKDNPFVDYNGKQALNFQISILLYSVILCMITVPLFFGFLPGIFEGSMFDMRDFDHMNSINIHYDSDWYRVGRLFWPLGILGLLQFALFLINIVYSIIATLRTNEGIHFSYPITIKFIK